MRAWKLRTARRARRDLEAIEDWVTNRAGLNTADRYMTRVERYLGGLPLSPLRGSMREDIGPGIRTVGFERRLTIVFRASEGEVTILRLLSGGQDVEAALDQLRSDR